MPTPCFKCDICGAPHDTQTTAKKCEESHCFAVDVDIARCKFAPGTFDEDSWSPAEVTLSMPRQHPLRPGEISYIQVVYIRKPPEQPVVVF